jgi:hypothetical protein
LKAASAIPILRFRAGYVQCAVAARGVHTVRAAPADRPPLWRLLEMPVLADDAERTSAWMLGLSHRDASAEVLVQGPVEITDVTAGDLLRRPPTLVLSRNDLIFGYVRCARDLVALLDIPALVQLASSRSEHLP